jgi:phosphoglycolate phosphatase-like HAD superfamily hydrolase
MIERPHQVIFDADGVLLDSIMISMDLSAGILGLFGDDEPIQNRAEQLRRFGQEAQKDLVGAEYAPTLRAMHRLLMRHHARRIPHFAPVLAAAGRVREPCRIVTATFAEGVRIALGGQAALFSQIEGRESGTKHDVLRRAVTGTSSIYVTDTVSDVRTCQNLGVPAIAVTWGYDDAARLASVDPEYLVDSADDLSYVFDQLGLTCSQEAEAHEPDYDPTTR